MYNQSYMSRRWLFAFMHNATVNEFARVDCWAYFIFASEKTFNTNDFLFPTKTTTLYRRKWTPFKIYMTIFCVESIFPYCPAKSKQIEANRSKSNWRHNIDPIMSFLSHWNSNMNWKLPTVRAPNKCCGVGAVFFSCAKKTIADVWCFTIQRWYSLLWLYRMDLLLWEIHLDLLAHAFHIGLKSNRKVRIIMIEKKSMNVHLIWFDLVGFSHFEAYIRQHSSWVVLRAQYTIHWLFTAQFACMQNGSAVRLNCVFKLIIFASSPFQVFY